MNRPLLVLLALLGAAPLHAVDVDPRLEAATRAALPVCAEATLSWQELPIRLLPRFTGALAKVESESPACASQFAAVLSPTGGVFLGMPWVISEEEGATIEEKLKNFTWRNMRENVTATVERKANTDGLWNVSLSFLTESGAMPMAGAVDPEGRIFFFGTFRRGSDVPAQRLAALEAQLKSAPAKGPAGAPVTLVEFSDFQCPSCRRASSYVDPIVAKHGDKVRYVRFDLPLSGHAWAFPAALAGRAIYRQKPDLFWEYKKAVYENQDELNPFLFWDWARGFAEDHGVDMARWDADLASPELKRQILEGAGLALSNDVHATPTYMVNGTIVEYGTDGAALAAHVDALLK